MSATYKSPNNYMGKGSDAAPTVTTWVRFKDAGVVTQAPGPAPSAVPITLKLGKNGTYSGSTTATLGVSDASLASPGAFASTVTFGGTPKGQPIKFDSDFNKGYVGPSNGSK